MCVFRSLIRNGLSLSILVCALLVILGPSRALGQQAHSFGTTDVPCPTHIPAENGENIICNGSINFLTTELFFEPETPPETLKGAPTTWNELEQLLDNPYLYAWGAACNDAKGPVPGTEQGYPTYCTPTIPVAGAVGGTFFRRPTTVDASGRFLVSTLPPLLVHPLNYNPQTGFGAQMRVLNPNYTGSNFQVSGTVPDLFSPGGRTSTGVCYGVGASCTPATQSIAISAGADRDLTAGTITDPGTTEIDMNVGIGRQLGFCQTNPEPIPITGTYGSTSTQFDSENLMTCGADPGEPGAASLAHNNTSPLLCVTEVLGAGSLAGYLCEDNMGLPVAGQANTSPWYSLPAVRAPSAMAAMLMQIPNGGLTTTTANSVAYMGTGVIINPGAPTATAPIGGFRLSDPARGGVINPLDIASGVGGLHKPSLRKAEYGGTGANPNYLFNSANAVTAARPHPMEDDLQPSNENDYVGLFGAGSLAVQKQQARLEAMVLGKALFWDQQVGSDAVQACGSCHAHAAADNRTKNQINPNGQDGLKGDPTNFTPNHFEHGVNTDLTASDFPFVKLRDPEIAGDPLCTPAIRANVIGFTFPDGDPLDHPKNNKLNIGVGVPADDRVCDASNRIADDTDDVASSMGVHFGLFGDIPLGTGTGLANPPGPTSPFGPASHGVRALIRDQRSSTALGALHPDIDNTDPIAGFMGSAVEADGSMHQFRRVEPRNTPTIDLADMNFDNFWDARARHDDNGGSVFGASDPQAHVFVTTNTPNSPNGTLTPTRQLIKFSSLGALAKGPALSKFEMSFDGRNWAKIGKKLLQAGVTPLANQLVDPTDSILGRYSNQGGSACGGLPVGDRAGGYAVTPGAPGLCISYPALIRHAFYAGLWQNTSNHLNGCYTDPLHADIHPNQCVGLPPISILEHPSPGVDVLNETTNTADPFDAYRLTSSPGAASASDTNQFSQMEANFSLFWGQSIHIWATVLVPDDTPDDKFLDANPDLGAAMGESGEPLLVLDLPNCPNPTNYRRGYFIGSDGFLQYRGSCFTEVGNFKRDPFPGPTVHTQNDTSAAGHPQMTACINENTVAGVRVCTRRVNAGGTRNPATDPDPLLGFDIFFGSNASLKNPNFRSARCGACHNAPALTDNTSPFTVKAQELDNFGEFERANPTLEPLTEPAVRERVISGFLLESEINEPGQDAIERKAPNLGLVPAPVVANNGNCITDNCSGYVFPDAITAKIGPDGTYSDASLTPGPDGRPYLIHADLAGGPVAGPGEPVPYTSFGGVFLDNGVYNIGVRPCVADESKVTGACEDVGRGGTDAFGWPLSLSALMLKNFGGPGQQPGVPIDAFDPSAATTRGDELPCAPYCATGGLLEPTAQDQHINPGYDDDPAEPAVPGYLAPFLNRVPVGDEHPQSDEGCGPVAGCVNTLMDVANEEGFPELPFNPRAANVEVTNGAIASGDSDVGLTGAGCGVGGGTAPCNAGVTSPMTRNGFAEMGTWPVVNRVNRFGAFKAPQLREVELTGPYFHNGGKLTLRQVVDFYVRGGDFPVTNSNHRDFNILNLNAELQSDLSEEEKVALVDYMLEFTDDRVAHDAGPFDHPQLILPLDGTAPESDGTFALQDVTATNCVPSALGPGVLACNGNLSAPPGATGPLFLSVPATGAAGVAARLPNFLGIAGAAPDALNPLGRKRLVGAAAFCQTINSQYCH